ncbi:hypothetical protein K439DRAFT_1662249 [Ramaria rubella]|nr:hypothetical protein K439DRAFT_1662249 [Ramaria rubella]
MLFSFISHCSSSSQSETKHRHVMFSNMEAGSQTHSLSNSNLNVISAIGLQWRFFGSTRRSPNKEAPAPKLHVPSAPAALPRLELPTFSSIEVDFPDRWHSVDGESSGSSTPSLEKAETDRQDILIEDLLDHIAHLRHKVRALGDANFRLRQTQASQYAQESRGANQNIARASVCSNAHTAGHSFVHPEGDEKAEIWSQNDHESDYSYYRNPDNFPASSIHFRTGTPDSAPANVEHDPLDNTTATKRRRTYSLPTPKEMIEFAESRPRSDSLTLDLDPHIREFLSLLPEQPVEQETYTVTLDESLDASSRSTPSWGPTTESKRIRPRPQPRARTYLFEPVFRCFTCSQKFGHCVYNQSLWMANRYIYFGYFETWFFYSSLAAWGPIDDTCQDEETSPALNVSTSVVDSPVSTCDHALVEDSEHDVTNTVLTPSSLMFSCPNNSRTRLDNFPHSSDETATAVDEAQQRRQRHTALLDSIVEEEETDDHDSNKKLAEFKSPAEAKFMCKRPSYTGYRSNYSSLEPIPEHDESADSMSQCPPLTDKTSSSPRQGTPTPSNTFDDDLEPDYDTLTYSSNDTPLPTPPATVDDHTFSVPFPQSIKKFSRERMSWWEMTVEDEKNHNTINDLRLLLIILQFDSPALFY